MPCPCFIPSPRSVIRSPQSTVHCPNFLLTAKQNGYKHSNEEITKVLEINYNCRKQFFLVTRDNCQNRSHSRAISSPIHAENWAVITTMSPSARMLYTRPSSTILFISWKYAQINQFWPSLFSSTGIVSSRYSPPY